MSEFEAAYETKVVPILEQHALTPSSERGHATPKGVFSRLFEVESPSAVAEIREALQRDPAWTEALRDLGRAFGTAGPEGLAQYGFDLYAAPAGPGKAVSAGRGQGHWRTYNTTDGLPDIMVRSIFQDREGYLWIGSYGGVSRFDGRTFATFTAQDGLADNLVLSILQDREGDLWFSTSNGVSRCDPSTLRQARRSSGGAGQRFITFTTREGLAHHDVMSALQDRNGYLWFGTVGGGVSRYDGETFVTFTTADGLAHNEVLSVLEDREGYLWFGTNGGVSRYDGKSWTTFTTADGLAHNEVLSVLQDREGHLWFGTCGGGVSRYDPSAKLRAGGKTFSTFTTEDGLADNQVRSIFQDREGHLWFGTYGGVSRYDRAGRRSGESSGVGTFITFTTEDGLAHNKVYSILEDREGHLWFGTYGGGVSRYSGRTLTTFTTRDGLAHNEVTSVFQDGDGCLWFCAGQGGVSRYDGRTFVTFTTQDGLAHDEMHSIFQDREGRLWFGDEHGSVSRYDGKTFTVLVPQYGLIHNRVWAILEDREGYLWFGTRHGGVIRYDPLRQSSGQASTGSEPALPVLSTVEGSETKGQGGEAFTPFTALEGLADDEVYSILQDREGYLWFGTRYDGACRYDGKALTAFTQEHGLANNWVRSIFEDREGRLWFGTNGGVSRCDPPFDSLTLAQGKLRLADARSEPALSETKGQVSAESGRGGRAIITFTKEDGLENNSVWPILQDREGHLWFGTSGGGVSRYDGQVFQTITRQDGLAHDGVRSIFQDREGNLWFGANGGVTRYCPPAPAPPPVFIDAVVADRRYEGESDLSAPFRAGLVVFEFHGMSFKTRPEAMVYRYRLKGYEEEWRNTRERRVEYQDLPIGSYTFEVVAVDRDLVYSEEPARVNLTVVRDTRDEQIDELERRVQERTRELQEANEALSGVNRELFKLNRELQEKTRALEEANRQVQEMTERKSRFLASMSHELRTPMNAIIGFTNLVLRRSGDALPERQRDNLTKVKQASDHLMALINDILDLSKIEAGRLDVRPVQFEVRTLIASCCATVSPLVKPGVTLSHQILDGVGEAHTDEAKLRQVVINLLSNALKFTESGEVRVSVRPSPRLASLGFPSPTGGRGVDRAAGRGEGLSPSEISSEDKILEIAVSDTGVGIPADSLGLIFDEFRQVEGSYQQQKGTGLGLSITKKLTELLGGTIGVESEVGKGSVFTVRIPLVYQERQDDEIKRGDSSPRKG